MSHLPIDGIMSHPAEINRSRERLRRHQDRQNTLLAIFCTLLLYLLVVCCILLLDLWRVMDVGQWRGPVQVKIGTPSAPPSPLQPDVEETAAASLPTAPPPITEPLLEEQNPAPAARPSADKPQIQESQAADFQSTETPEAEVRDVQERPARVQGVETGNSYVIDFDGVEGEVGRAGAYEFISSYMPLPEAIDAILFDNASEYLNLSLNDIRRELEKYWEPFRSDYIKKPGIQGVVPLADRPYYWSLLRNALHFDAADADWRNMDMRPVIIEFKVLPSDDIRGAELTDLKMITRTSNPMIDEAILYGISRWVYYNDSDHAIRGRITYRFKETL